MIVSRFYLIPTLLTSAPIQAAIPLALGVSGACRASGMQKQMKFDGCVLSRA